jgi:collagen type I alpha
MGRTKLAARVGVVGLLAAILAATAGASSVAKHTDAKQDLALTAKFFAAHKAALKGAHGARGPVGLPGASGTTGPAGPTGPAGATNVTVVRTDVTVSPMTAAGGYANCPPGQKATGGGVGAVGGGNIQTDSIVESAPVNQVNGSLAATTTGTTPLGWYGAWYNGTGGSTETAYIWAICAAP